MKRALIALTLLVGVIVLVIVGMRMNTARNQLTENASKPVTQQQLQQITSTTNSTQQSMTQSSHPHITLVTNKGNIEIELSADVTPNTVENFLTLAGKDFYDGTKFHRVIEGFMIQGGDPLSKDDTKMMYWGTGDPGYKFNDEITAVNKNDRGTISMANSGPNTNGSQFFINLVDNNFLDTKHTVFGKVVSGMDVVDAIGIVPTGQSDRPIDPVIITDIVVQ